MNARPIWTQSGIGPKFIRSRVNGALKRNFQDLRIDHHSSPAGEIHLYKFVLIDRFARHSLCYPWQISPWPPSAEFFKTL